VLRARIYDKQRWTNEALADLNRVLAMTPQDAASYKARAELLHSLGDYSGAQRDLEMAAVLQPGDTQAVLRQARLLEEQLKLDEALALYSAAIQVTAEPSELYIHAGKLRYSLEQYRRALANFEAALTTKPDSSLAYYGVGLAQRQLGNFPAAIAAFKQYLKLAPGAPERPELEGWMQKHGS
jgi:tetratricopeptide (TPR) repeat protein